MRGGGGGGGGEEGKGKERDMKFQSPYHKIWSITTSIEKYP